MSEENQYKTPTSNVEQSSNTEYGSVKLLAVGGRIGRIRYIAYNFGLFIALFSVVMLATFVAGVGVSPDAGMSIFGIIMMLITMVVYLFFFVVTIMLTIQRAHDFNASGWLSLVTFIPLASLIFLFIPGTDGENQYGLKTPPNGAATVVVIVMFLIIPIVGILAAIAVPAYQGYIDKAQQSQMEQSFNQTK
ncbi:MAG: DUF805 domain-containing protein [Gammaproteobacteria bacterium]